MNTTRDQVLAFRFARHHLHERLPAGESATAAAAGLQDTPPGSAAVALAARVDAGPEAMEQLVTVYSVRGAPLAVAPEDVPLFTTALDPPDERSAATQIQSAAPTLEGISALDALHRVSDAIEDALAGGPLNADDFHQALRERLPPELLWWCRGCGSHHVHPSLWRTCGVRGVLAVVGREGRSAVYGLPPEPRAPGDGGELVRRYLRAYGPSTPQLFRLWAGIAPGHAKALWARAGELAQVELERARRWLLAEDADALAAPPPAAGVRLLPNLDPLTAGKDRELLVPDDAVRKRIWKMLGGPGTVWVDGALAGLWRPAKKGKRLLVNVEPLAPLKAAAREALAAEAERLGPFRGAERAELAWAA